jgi:hypothetical protein
VSHGNLVGRPLAEAFRDGETPAFERKILASSPSGSGLKTILNYQVVGKARYFDAAGFAGRTVGVDPNATSVEGNERTGWLSSAFRIKVERRLICVAGDRNGATSRYSVRNFAAFRDAHVVSSPNKRVPCPTFKPQGRQ